MRLSRWSRVGLAIAFLGGALLPRALHASAVSFIDHLIITRNPLPVSPGQPGFVGTYEGQGIFYADLFADDNEPPSAGIFAAQIAPPAYGVFGAYGPSDESGGKLRLDSAMGGLTSNAAGQARRTQQAVLLSDANPANAVAGLKQAFHTFSIYGLFDLTLPPNPGDSYQLLLRDDGPGLFLTEEIGIALARLENGSLAIRSFHQDFVGGFVTILDSDPLAFPAGADQVEFRLERAALGSDLVTTAYRFLDDGSPVTAFVVMDGATAFFNNRPWARAGFRATEVVIPEPGTLALLLAAIGLLAFSAARRNG